ncbi:MAG TPA: cell envelope integrity protein CreD [Rhizomicrobium sp.]|nr:cell envelope integrity protein CreD [Rhizomicrobium sp.]
MALGGVLSGSATRSPGMKLILVIVLTVAMAAPLFLIQLALAERESTAQAAAQDIASGWGGPQTVAGPMLFVPYTIAVDTVVNGGTVRQLQTRTAVLLPSTLDMSAKTSTHMLWRGIFKVPTYRADVAMHAKFDHAAIAALIPAGGTPTWKDAFAAIAVSDAHGVADNVALEANGHGIAFQPGVIGGSYPGVHAPIDLTETGDLDLRTRFVLRGSRELSLVPLGQRTTAAMDSTWGSPSFFGTFLPTERTIDAKGFRASWTVPYLARGFGQSFATSDEAIQTIQGAGFGVRFYQPVDHYQLVQRSLKYAILFVALAFLIFFVVEIVSERRLHAIQYALVGAAQVLFYLLLLSLAEHVGFPLAYLAAAGATVALTGLYSLSVLASVLRSAVLTIVLAALYGLLYVILNAEDYALLIGSAVLFAALATTMYLTRRIDWYGAAPAPA